MYTISKYVVSEMAEINGMIERCPTLCEINYNPLDSRGSFLSEDYYTPFRYRTLRSLSPEYHERHKECTFTSSSYYKPAILGSRTPSYYPQVSEQNIEKERRKQDK